jgi:protein-S-isoprenylcysteine O-methyltransferase Ste14
MLTGPEGGLWTGLAIAYHLASRLAYVFGVGGMLARQDRGQWFTRRYGVEAGFLRFRRLASIIMNNDAGSFVVLCLVARQTLPPGFRPALLIPAGVLLIAAGVSVKLWAAARLGAGAYYWENFFVAGPFVAPDPPGPYRYLRNPMYTVGYLHAYGFALACLSLPGLLAAAFDQGAILLFHHVVERPHFLRLTRGAS